LKATPPVRYSYLTLQGPPPGVFFAEMGSRLYPPPPRH
jgi:hypothetical protein